MTRSSMESAVRADRELIAPAFEEVLRLRPPLTQAARPPTADVEIDPGTELGSHGAGQAGAVAAVSR
ncbi:hypothetical protein AB0J35_12800 [Nonomuraea angiospora]|uniref:hypothetical protein n=1 Tax=Nonomuraea angiospora TaxID=46172 RepID=UPI0034173456